MDSTASTLSMSSPLDSQRQKHNSVYEWSVMQKLTSLPAEFHWPDDELVKAREGLMASVIDLEGFLKGDEEETQKAASLIRTACVKHGFFQVINHKVDPNLIRMAQDHMDNFFKLPTSDKLGVLKKPGSLCGYSSAHADRFSSKLPWKEMLSFSYENSSDPVVLNFFTSNLGKDFEQTGRVYQKYCEAMEDLSLSLMELLAISLGVDRLHFRKFYEDGLSLLRCNYYPPCQEPDLTLGTGPHCDPTSLTLLHQDQVGGLEVFVNNKWHTVEPIPEALVVNIGDTFEAFTNGIYKSCLHRAVVNKCIERKSLAFFLCPREDKVVSPPEDLVRSKGKRIYPDFTWSQFVNFTQKHYRANQSTLHNFANHLLSSKATN